MKTRSEKRDKSAVISVNQRDCDQNLSGLFDDELKYAKYLMSMLLYVVKTTCIKIRHSSTCPNSLSVKRQICRIQKY